MSLPSAPHRKHGFHMDSQDLQSRLSQISTHWSLLQQAHDEDAERRREAVEQLLAHYGAPIRRYLQASLGSADGADELLQEFAVRLLRGTFHNADPARGRFRHYLKRSLIHLVLEYRKRQAAERRRFGRDGIPEVEASADDEDARLRAGWRDELLARAWTRLQDQDASRGHSHYPILKCRAECPALSSAQLAAELNERLRPEHPWNGAAARKALQRAREAFGQALLEEVAALLASCNVAEIEEELAELELLPYCRSALAEWKSRRGLV